MTPALSRTANALYLTTQPLNINGENVSIALLRHAARLSRLFQQLKGLKRLESHRTSTNSFKNKWSQPGMKRRNSLSFVVSHPPASSSLDCYSRVNSYTAHTAPPEPTATKVVHTEHRRSHRI